MVVEISFGEDEILDMLTMTRSEIIRAVLQRLRYYKNQDGEIILKSQSQSKSSSLSFIAFGSDLFLLQIPIAAKHRSRKQSGVQNLNTKTQECDQIDLLTISKTDAS